MKKILKYCLFLLFSILLCSCSIKNDNNLTIKSDGTLEYDVLLAFDKELLENMISVNNINEESNKKIDTKDMKEYFNKNIKDSYLDGLKKEQYNDKDYIGNKYSYKIDDINEVSSNRTDTVVINDYDSKDKLIDKDLFKKEDDVYTANFIYNTDENGYGGINVINTFVVKLPTRGFKHNADEVKDNGKTLIWHVDNIKDKKINFSFKLKDKKYIISLLCIVFDIGIISMFIYLMVSKRKLI